MPVEPGSEPGRGSVVPPFCILCTSANVSYLIGYMSESSSIASFKFARSCERLLARQLPLPPPNGRVPQRACLLPPEQLRAGFELYRALPASEKFNAAERSAIDVPLVLAGGERSFGPLLPGLGETLLARMLPQATDGLAVIEAAARARPGRPVKALAACFCAF